MLARIVVLAVATVLAISAQITIHGEVRNAADSSPIPEAKVLAIAGQPRSIIAAAVTDAQGRYRLEIATSRFELTVDAFGFFVARAGDVEAETFARVCPDRGDCGRTDFVLTGGAVFDGWVTDKYGNPMESIEITLTPTGDLANGEPGRPRPLIPPAQERNRNVRGVSDDRGYYRFWGLRPGSYRLTSRRSGSRYIGIPEPPELDQTIEIPAGEESARLNFQLADPPPTFTISGQLEGVAPDDKRWVTLEPLGGGDREIVYVKEGEFSHPVAAGEYVARLEQVVNTDPAANQVEYLATLVVDRDLADLRLRPQPPSGIRARVVFAAGPVVPFRLQFRRKGQPNSLPREIQFAQSEAEIERHGFLPGDYVSRLQAQDYFFIDPPEFTVVPGQLTEVVFHLSNQRSVLRGRARFATDAGRSAAAHVTVAVRGRQIRSVQTDDAGGFEFDKLIPGEYEIAAWARLVAPVEQDEAWREAGGHVKRITVKPGFEVEVDLTIAP